LPPWKPQGRTEVAVANLRDLEPNPDHHERYMVVKKRPSRLKSALGLAIVAIGFALLLTAMLAPLIVGGVK
jgi:hypothetical protein